MFTLYYIIVGAVAALSTMTTTVTAYPTNITTRSTDITCGGQFPRAGDGFAQRPDGCSSWGDNPAQVRDSWGSANFRGVCNDHDRCYYTRDANVDGCNENFCGGLRKACRNAYCTKILGATVCEPMTFAACSAIAETYCGAVRAVAASVYEKAQNKQKSYEACVTSNEGIPPPVVCSNGRPEGSTWSEKDVGSCTTTSYACRDGKITSTNWFRLPNCIEQ
jgi:hypothetical protein